MVCDPSHFFPSSRPEGAPVSCLDFTYNLPGTPTWYCTVLICWVYLFVGCGGIRPLFFLALTNNKNAQSEPKMRQSGTEDPEVRKKKLPPNQLKDLANYCSNSVGDIQPANSPPYPKGPLKQENSLIPRVTFKLSSLLQPRPVRVAR